LKQTFIHCLAIRKEITMQLRCSYCQTMFSISRDEMLAALQQMDLHKQKYYDAHCPKCRRANRVEGRRIEMFIPQWRTIIKDLEHGVTEPVKSEAKPVVKAAQAGVRQGANKAGGRVTTVKKAVVKVAKAKPAPVKAAAKKPAPAKPAVRKPAVKKPAARKPTPAGKTAGKASGGMKKK
jgi:hypothetical protein